MVINVYKYSNVILNNMPIYVIIFHVYMGCTPFGYILCGVGRL